MITFERYSAPALPRRSCSEQSSEIGDACINPGLLHPVNESTGPASCNGYAGIRVQGGGHSPYNLPFNKSQQFQNDAWNNVS